MDQTQVDRWTLQRSDRNSEVPRNTLPFKSAKRGSSRPQAKVKTGKRVWCCAYSLIDEKKNIWSLEASRWGSISKQAISSTNFNTRRWILQVTIAAAWWTPWKCSRKGTLIERSLRWNTISEECYRNIYMSLGNSPSFLRIKTTEHYACCASIVPSEDISLKTCWHCLWKEKKKQLWTD